MGPGAKARQFCMCGETAGTRGRWRKNTCQRKQASHQLVAYHRVPKALASTQVPMLARTAHLFLHLGLLLTLAQGSSTTNTHTTACYGGSGGGGAGWLGGIKKVGWGGVC